MGEREPADEELRGRRTKAIKMLIAFFDAAIAYQLKVKSKRQPYPERVAMIRPELSEAIVDLLNRLLNRLEMHFCKPYSAWTRAEHLEAAETVSQVCAYACEKFRRPSGRPRRTSGRGLIASHMYLPAKREAARMRSAQQKQLQTELFRFVDFFKEGRFAGDRYEDEDDANAAKAKLDKELAKGLITFDIIDYDVKAAEAVRDFIEWRGLPPDLQTRFKKAVSRRRLKHRRRS